MKNFLLAIALITFYSCSSSVNVGGGETGIVDVPGASKNQVYQKALQWLSYKFVSGKAVVDYKDPGTGRVIAKGTLIIPTAMGSRAEVHIVATIDCVAARSRISVETTDCASVAANGARYPCSGFYLPPSAFDEINSAPKNFIEDYRAYMGGTTAPAWDGKMPRKVTN